MLIVLRICRFRVSFRGGCGTVNRNKVARYRICWYVLRYVRRGNSRAMTRFQGITILTPVATAPYGMLHYHSVPKHFLYYSVLLFTITSKYDFIISMSHKTRSTRDRSIPRSLER